VPTAVEYLNGPQVLVLRIYGPLTSPELRDASHGLGGHGCYKHGIGILLEPTDPPDSRSVDDVRRLRQAVQHELPQSRVAVVWSRTLTEQADRELLSNLAAFNSRDDALRWCVRRL
jgi:hypothetical protein